MSEPLNVFNLIEGALEVTGSLAKSGIGLSDQQAVTYIVGPLVGIGIVTFVIRYLLEEGDVRKILGELIRVLLLGGMVVAALNPNPGAIFGYQQWTGFVRSMTNFVAPAELRSGDGGAVSAIGKVTSKMFDTMGNVWDAEVKKVACENPGASGASGTGAPSTGDAVAPPCGAGAAATERGALSTMIDTLMNMPMLLMRLAAKVIAIFLLAVGLAVFIGEYVASQIMIDIALAVGPLFIPWLVWKPTEFLTTGWMKFLITSFLAAALATLIVGKMTMFIDVMIASALADIAKNDGWAVVMNWVFLRALIVIILAAVLLPIVVSKTSSIASGLISGHFASLGAGMVAGAAVGKAGAMAAKGAGAAASAFGAGVGAAATVAGRAALTAAGKGIPGAGLVRNAAAASHKAQRAVMQSKSPAMRALAAAYMSPKATTTRQQKLAGQWNKHTEDVFGKQPKS